VEKDNLKGRADNLRQRDGKKNIGKSGRLFLKIKYNSGDIWS
jgi:hypothetical protein